MIKADPQQLKKKLVGYLKGDPHLKKVFDYTKQRFNKAQHLTAHNWEHTYRDTLNAIVIGEAEKADMKIVMPAIVLHDIGYLYGGLSKNHARIGAKELAGYLAQVKVAFSKTEFKQIADCIRTHKGSMHNEHPKALEAKVVADADMLEKFGPFGVYQYLRSATELNKPIVRVLERADGIKSLTFETATGKALAEPGRQFVADFFAKLHEANKPYKS